MISNWNKSKSGRLTPYQKYLSWIRPFMFSLLIVRTRRSKGRSGYYYNN